MRAFIPAVLWGIIILIISLMPGSSLPNFSFFDLFQPDKVGHLVFYGIFVALMLLGFHQRMSPEEIEVKTVAKVVAFGICYGILIELLQYSFFTGRNFDVLDIIANIIGCFVGVSSLKLFSLFLR